jgi:hypothetical protein
VSVDPTTETQADRCSLHPGSQAVATCGGCGRPLCLWCAVPVRGVAYGNECLHLVLGEDRPFEDEAPAERAPSGALIGFGIALAATVLPWTRFGEGDSPFGAWSLSPRWALLAAVASVLGLGVTLVARRRARPDPRWVIAEVAFGAAVVVGSVLEWLRPPFPSRPTVAPWIAAAGGMFAVVSAVRCLRKDANVGR